MDQSLPAGLPWAAFQALARLDSLAAAPAHLRLYAFSADRESDPGAIAPRLRQAAVALILSTGNAIVVLADEHYAPELAAEWRAALHAHGHAVTRWLRASAAVVGEFYRRDAERRRIAAEATASATEGARQLVQLLVCALQRGASDVDVVVDEEAVSTTLRLRIHGEWVTLSQAPNVYGLDLMRAAFAAVRLDERMRGKAAWSPRADLAGVARFCGLHNLQVRLQQIVERSGVGLTLRLLTWDGLAQRHRSLADLGFAPPQAAALSRALGHAGGLVLIAGATGSGKTTTLNVAVATSPRFAQRKWVSIEDPPEIDTPGIFQIPVATPGCFGAIASNSAGDADGGDAFADAMRKVLRFTPDGVIAGEIRDRAGAQLAVQMALTGHVVAASLHASDAFIALSRLTGRDLAVDAAVLQEPGVLSAIVAQRLLPRLCECRLNLDEWRSTATEHEQHVLQRAVARLGLESSTLRLRHPQGCERCRAGRAGYAGRVVCTQLVEFDADLLATWRTEGIDAARERWRAAHMRRGSHGGGSTIAAHAMHRVRHGECDARDVLAAFDMADLLCQAPRHPQRDLSRAASPSTI